MGNTPRSKQQQLVRDQGLIAGIPKRLASASILVNGTTYTATTAVAFLQTRVNTVTALVIAKAAYQAAVKAADAEAAASDATVSGLVEAIYVGFGDDPAALADFNLPVRKKPGALTPAERLAASAKAQATRLARNTMGPKQKAKITGATAPATAPAATTTPPVGVPATTPTK